MDIPKVYKDTDETQTIKWLQPRDTSIGSVFVYRATDYRSYRLGSLSLIGSLSASTLSYTDTSGSSDNIYAVRFITSSGSSPLSTPIGDEYNTLLCTMDDIRSSARLTANSDIGSVDLYRSAKDATVYAEQEYGRPIKKTVIFVDSNTGYAGQAYEFSAEQEVYSVLDVTFGNAYPELIAGSSYEIDKQHGLIKFTDAFINAYAGNYVWIEWVPRGYHNLVKNLAAFDIIDASKIVDGRTIFTPDGRRLNRLVESAKESVRPKTITYTSMDFGIDGADYIGQKTQRKHLFFSL